MYSFSSLRPGSKGLAYLIHYLLSVCRSLWTVAFLRRSGLLRWITTLLVCSFVGLQRFAFLRWITCFFVRSLVDYRRQLLFRSSLVGERSHLRVCVNCRNRWVSTSVSVVELPLCQRQPLDLVAAFWLWRSTSVVSYLSLHWTFRRTVSTYRTGSSPSVYIAHRCVAVCNLHHSKLL